MQMKPNSIWFQDTSYQDEVLSHRVAWQFINALTVKILRYKPRTHQVNVEMTEPGRLEGTEWWLDADALVR